MADVVTCIARSPSDKFYAVGVGVRLYKYHLGSNAREQIFPGIMRGAFVSAAVSDRTVVAAVHTEDTTLVLTQRLGTVDYEEKSIGNAGRDIAVGLRGESVIVASHDAENKFTIREYVAGAAPLVVVGGQNASGLKTTAISIDGARVATTWGVTGMRVWKLAPFARTQIEPLFVGPPDLTDEGDGPADSPLNLQFSDDGRLLASMTGRGTLVRIHDTDTGALVDAVHVMPRDAHAEYIALSPDARLVACAQSEGDVVVYHVDSSAAWRIKSWPMDTVTCMAFLDKGAALAVGSTKGMTILPLKRALDQPSFVAMW